MNVVIIKPSHLKQKKFNAIVNGTKTIPFGAKGYEDFTIHKNEARKERYISRHQKREDWGDPMTAGFYSRWVLWNKKTLQTSIDDMNERFKNKNIHFVLRL